MLKIISVVVSIAILISLFLTSQISLSSTKAGFQAHQVYKIGTAFHLSAHRLWLSAEGTMEVLEKTKFREEEVILIRSQITKVGGLMGFIVKFLRIYKESNTFDSYIDSDTFLTARYEVYKLKKDGSKKLTEDVYFDRLEKRVLYLEDNTTIVDSVAPDIQDAFSIFLNLLCRLNTEELYVGKKFLVDLYAYKKSSTIEIEITGLVIKDDVPTYTLEIDRLPGVFKYDASVEIKVTDTGGGFMFPVSGKCTIDIPVLPDVTINGKLSKVR